MVVIVRAVHGSTVAVVCLRPVCSYRHQRSYITRSAAARRTTTLQTVYATARKTASRSFTVVKGASAAQPPIVTSSAGVDSRSVDARARTSLEIESAERCRRTKIKRVSAATSTLVRCGQLDMVRACAPGRRRAAVGRRQTAGLCAQVIDTRACQPRPRDEQGCAYRLIC